jgi:iduronate 2-sulfatase
MHTVILKRTVPNSLFAIASLLVSSALLGAAAPNVPRKNVLLIVSDDLNWCVGCYGHPVAKTPNIDALARQGVRFDRAYCQVSVCNPSRASFLTGLRPARTGVYNQEQDFRTQHPDILTLPQYFKKKGYWTGAVGKIFHQGCNDEPSWTWQQPWASAELQARKEKNPQDWAQPWHLDELKSTLGEGRNVSGGRLPWSVWRSVTNGLLMDDRICEMAIQKIKGFTNGQPFFLGVGFIRPHDLFFAPKKYFDMYPLDSLKLPPQGSTGIPRSAYGVEEWKDAYESMNDQDKKELLRSWYAGVSYTDYHVGQVLAALKQQGLADSTIVVFMGDNGYHNWEKDWWGKCTVWELSARVPLIIAGAGVPQKNGSSEHVVELLDLAPTLVQLAGLPPMPDRDGRSLVPLLISPNLPAEDWKNIAYTEYGQELRSVRTGKWRYCKWGTDEALYNEITDPDENTNLVKNPEARTILKELRQKLAAMYPTNAPVVHDGPE